jgi:hypothetical protein
MKDVLGEDGTLQSWFTCQIKELRGFFEEMFFDVILGTAPAEGGKGPASITSVGPVACLVSYELKSMSGPT